MSGLAGTAVAWPSLDQVLLVLAFGGGYNTVVVMIGVALLGLAAGVVGTFAVLRKRAMMSDTLSHATLPGIALAFLAAVAVGAEGRSLPVLLGGAAAAGIAGVLAVQALVRHSRLPEDAAMGAVLSVFFGLGFVLLSHIQTLGTGAEGGIAKFIYGQTAAMSVHDATVIGAVAAAATLVTALLYKEFRLVCFDPDYAAVQGWPVSPIDLAMMALVVVVTVVGLQAVGLILVVALIIVPAAAARFWTDRLGTMTVLAAGFGAASGYVGAALSALLPRFPAGGIIVLVAGAVFLASLFFAPRRGVIAGTLRHARLRLAVEREHLLRGLYEAAEAAGTPLAAPVDPARLRIVGTWSPLRRTAVLASLRHAGLLRRAGSAIALTPDGQEEAWRVTRNHRLWEEFLVSYAHLAPTHVDRSADLVEHVLDGAMVARLEEQLAAIGRLPRLRGVPKSLHA
ncbi:metal ABC transporter permease [Azospirillum sp. ST 5-10]|uniref:metal ABC transporter permease n=1 Tax=unclassified Azospirillum TaxID=2630922 RepID=UPI003F4A3B03